MKNLALSTFLFFCFAVFADVAAQNSDADLRDNNIRMRSNDLEQTKRDAAKNNSGSASQMNYEIDKKFPEIKDDYEGIQLAQDAIVKAYTTGEKINYEQIEKSAKEVNKNAERLRSNLFISEAETKKEKDEKKIKSVKDLIVDLDKAVGAFVASAMFQNLRVVEQKTADKAQTHLAQIIKISRELSREAGKMK